MCGEQSTENVDIVNRMSRVHHP